MSEQILREQLAGWERKSIIRYLYRKWFEVVQGELVIGATLEVGGGIGKFKEQAPNIVTMDICKTPWTDVVGDAQRLPIKSRSLANVVLFDVLHHLPRPNLFFTESERVLQPGGRIVLVEPYLSVFSYPVYRWLHREGASFTCDPFGESPMCSDAPFDSNQAVATMLFFRHKKQFAKAFPSLRVIRRQRLALLAYPLSGGFGGKALFPYAVLRWLSNLESYFSVLAPLCAFRTLVVLEKV